ncbi:MAG: AAA-like domain-containing protein [Acidobacteriaceae bacterium]|nr:AAA-like domain-containing protein [Acidobacteriaceae bacterium]MBV9294155.1 AAA-like domain-containing protein [Acidobacteriaceae bacterium]
MSPDVLTKPTPDYYVSGGALKANAPSYVPRSADTLLLDAIRAREFCYVLTPRQMGKTSLMVRTAATLRNEGVRSVLIDLTQIGTQVTAEQWYLGHLKRIAKELALQINYLDWWEQQKHLGIVQRFIAFLTEIALPETAEPIAIFIDEIDTTLNLNYSDDYFAAIRSLYNQRAADAHLERLTFVLLGVASPSDLIKDVKRTPFNIGTRIPLTDFTDEESAPLLTGLAPSPDAAKQLLRQVLFWTAGHPYLTQKTCRAVAAWSLSEKWNPKEVPIAVDDLIKELYFSEAGRNTDSNLQFVRDRILESPDVAQLLRLYGRVRQSDPVTDDELDPLRVALKLTGLIKTTETGLLKVRNLVYDRVFDEIWIRTALTKMERASPLKKFIEKTGDLFKEKKGPDDSLFRYDVYVSYSHRDRDWVKSYLLPNLESAGLSVFIDPDYLPGGAMWERRLDQAFNQSRNILLIMSPDYFASKWTEIEVGRAMRLLDDEHGRRVIPILLKPAHVPASLQRIQWVNFTGRLDRIEPMQRLLQALGATHVSRTALESNQLPTSDKQYDTGTIRALLDEALDYDDLTAFAYDYFRPAYELLDEGAGKKARIQTLIEYADREHELDKLLDRLAQTRPKEYRRYADRLELPSS